MAKKTEKKPAAAEATAEPVVAVEDQIRDLRALVAQRDAEIAEARRLLAQAAFGGAAAQRVLDLLADWKARSAKDPSYSHWAEKLRRAIEG
jgi:hypothetical protein